MFCHHRAYHSNGNILLPTRPNIELHNIIKNKVARPDFIHFTKILHNAAGRCISNRYFYWLDSPIAQLGFHSGHLFNRVPVYFQDGFLPLHLIGMTGMGQ